MTEKNFESESLVSDKNIFLRIFSKTYILLLILGVAGVIIRLFTFPYDIPLGMDATSYFWYATDMSILGNFPSY